MTLNHPKNRPEPGQAANGWQFLQERAGQHPNRFLGTANSRPEDHELRISAINHLNTIRLRARMNKRALHVFWANPPGPSTSTTACHGLFGSCRFGMRWRRSTCARS